MKGAFELEMLPAPIPLTLEHLSPTRPAQMQDRSAVLFYSGNAIVSPGMLADKRQRAACCRAEESAALLDAVGELQHARFEGRCSVRPYAPT